MPSTPAPVRRRFLPSETGLSSVDSPPSRTVDEPSSNCGWVDCDPLAPLSSSRVRAPCVGRSAPNCELFAGRFLYRELVRRPRISSQLASGPSGLEASFSILGCAAPPLRLTHIIAASPLRRQGRSWRRDRALPQHKTRHSQEGDGHSVSGSCPSPLASGSRREAR